MGQWIVIQDDDQDRINRLGEIAVDRFQSLCGLTPQAAVRSPNAAVWKFPRRLHPGTAIARAESGQGFTTIAGTWWFGGSCDEAALQALNATMQSPENPVDALRKLDGSFGVAACREETDELIAITDRIGTIHLYETRIGSARLVSTSSMVLASLARLDWDLDSVREFLACGTVFGQRSLFQGIRKLEPATIFSWRPGRDVETMRYWEAERVFWDRAEQPGSVEGLGQALRDTIHDFERCYSRPAMDLTGGLDSRAVLGAMLAEDIRFETVVNGDDDHPDVIAANRIASEFGLEHRQQVLASDWQSRWWERTVDALSLCDGEYDVLEYSRVLENHSTLAATFDASINGSGGEFCKGYWWELLYPKVGQTDFDPRKIAAGRFATDGWSDGLLVRPFDTSLADWFAHVISEANAGLEQHPNTAQLDNVYLTLRMQRWQGRIASATNRLWPCASPFMCREPMEQALGAPPAVRLRDRMSRNLIEHLNRRLAELPLAQGYPALPLRLSTAPRFWRLGLELGGKVIRKLSGRGQPPPPPRPQQNLGKLLAEEAVRDHLTPASMQTRELYEPARLEAFLAEALPGTPRHEAHLGRVLTLEMLARAVRRD